MIPARGLNRCKHEQDFEGLVWKLLLQRFQLLVRCNGAHGGEREIAALLIDGLTSKLIGKRLAISPRTVYRARQMRKVGAVTTPELVNKLLAGEAGQPSAANGESIVRAAAAGQAAGRKSIG